MTPRDPIALLERYGRQQLLQGVDLAGQQRLGALGVALTTDGQSTSRPIAAAFLRYLVGAGVGRVCTTPADLADGLAGADGLDSALQRLPRAADVTPPVANVHVAVRDYGASVDIVLVEGSEGWREGLAGPARVCTVRVLLGGAGGAVDVERCREATDADAVLIGTTAAGHLVDDLLGLAVMPAVATWWHPDGDATPTYAERPWPSDDRGGLERGLPAGAQPLLPVLDADPALLEPILQSARDCYPNEACGYILRAADGALRTVVERNLQDRYHALDPEQFTRTARAAYRFNELRLHRALEAGEQLVSIWHTHCDAGAYFSDEDVRTALHDDGTPLFPGIGYLVLSVMSGDVVGMEVHRHDAATGRFLAEPQA